MRGHAPIVVIDTNVVVSAALFPESVPALCLAHLVRHGASVLTEAMIAELAEVLGRPKFASRLTEERRHRFLAEYVAASRKVTPMHSVEVCRDPSDNRLLEAVSAAAADFLVTGDRDLLVLHLFEGTAILTPADFMARVRR